MIKPREIHLRKLISGLKKLGLDVNQKAARHTKATNTKTGRATMIPRHNPVKKSIFKSITEWLIAEGFTEEEIKKSLKIK